MKRKTVKTFRASITVGLQIGYSQEVISWNALKSSIVSAQKEVYEKFNTVLSAKVSLCEIICLGQEEPSATIEFIQYPKFIYEEELLKASIIIFTERVQQVLEQNRTVIVFDDETIMLEKTNKIDPNINI